LLVLLIATSTQAFAQVTWFWRNNESRGNLWGATDRWWNGSSGSTLGNSSSQDVLLSFDGSTELTSTNNATSASVRGILFGTGGSSRILDGNTLYVGFGGTGKIENNSGNTQTINLTISNTTANGLEINPVNGLLNFSNIYLGTNYVDMFGNNTVHYRGSVSGSAVMTWKTNSGTVTAIFSASNTLTSSFNIERGYMILSNASATAGTGTINIGGAGNSFLAELQLGAGAAQTNAIANAINIRSESGNTGANRSIASLSSSGTNLVTGAVTNNNAGLSSKIYIANGGTLRFSNVVSGAGGFFLDGGGGGTLELSSSNTITGGFYIDNGTIKLSGTSANAGNGALHIGTTGTATASNAVVLYSGTGGGITASNSLTVNTGGGRTIVSENTSGVNTFLGTAALNKDLTFSNAAGGEFRFGNTFSGSGGVTKNGSGTMTFSADASGIGGSLTINGGTLQIGAGSTTGTIGNKSVAIGANAIVFNRSDNLTYGGVISGTGGTFAKAGAGTLILTNANSYTGATTVSAGALRASNNTALGTVAGGAVVANGAALELEGGITIGAEALDLSGGGLSSGGALRNISGNNTYQGTITNTSAARINSDSGTLTLSGAINATNQSLTFGGNGHIVVSGAITNSTGSLTKDGSGSLTLSGNNTYTGGTLISAGTLQLGGGSTTGSLSSGNITNNATFLINRSDDITLNNAVSGTGALNKTGAGTLTLGGANTYTGKTTISNGAISVSAASGIGGNPGATTADQVTLNGGRLNVTTGFTANANAGITVGSSGGTIDIGGSQSMIQGGGLNGSAALTKTGAGTLALTNTAGNYSGAITLTNGGLKVNTSLGSATVSVGNTVSKGSVLSGAGTLGAVTINSGGLISPGNSPGTLSVSALTLNGGGGYQWEVTDATGGAGTGWDVISVGSGTGTVTVGATSGSQFTIYVTGNNPSNFNSASNYTWAFVDSQTVTGFAANAFAIDTSAFTGYSGSLGSFAVGTNSSGDMTLVYSGAASAYDVTVGASTATAQGSATGGAGQFTGAAALNKLGAGTLIMTNSANDYTGVTTVKEGTIQINVNAPNGSAGALGNASTGVLVGDNTNAAAAGLNLGAAGATNSRALTMVAGTGAADRTLSTTIVSGTAEQAGNVALNTNSVFSAASGGTLLVSGVVSGAGALAISNGGTTVLSGANTYTNTTTVLNGATLLAANSTALGTTDGATTVNSGGALALSNGITSAESITLGGTGIASDGAIRNVSGNNTLSGALTLAANGRINSDTGLLTLSGGINGANASLMVGGAGNTTVSGAITNSTGTLTKDGNGTLTLTGANTYSGGTLVSAGSLAGNTTSLQGTITNNSLVIFNQSADGTYSSVLSGTGALVKTNTGVLTLTGNNTQSGGTTIGQGTLAIGAGGTTGSLAGAITNNATLLYNRSDNLTQATVISGSGVLVKTNTGVLTLTAANTQSGGTLIAGGTLSIGGGSTTGSLAGAITNNATLLYNRSDNLTQATVISGTGVLNKAGGGTLTLSQANTYTGATTISNGAINVQNNTGLGTVAGGVTVTSGAALELQGGITIGAEALSLNGTGLGSGGALRNITGDNTYGGAITLGSASRINSDAGTLTLSGGITGTQNLTIGGAGNSTVNNAITTSTGTLTKDGAGTVTLSGANTFTGAADIQAGTLAISGGSALADAVNVSVASGATLAVNGSETIAQLTGAGTTTLAASQTLTSSFNNASAAYSGTFSGTGGLTKTGSGTLTLSGNSSGYSGATVLNNGTFLIGSDGALGTGTVTINYDSGTGTRELASSSSSGYTLNNNFNLYYNSFSLGQSSGGTGSLTLGGSGKTFSLGADGVATTRTITVNGTQTIAADVSGGANNNLNKAGNGTLILSGDASGIGGTITNSAGRLQIGNGSTTGTLGSNNVALTSGADLAFNRSDNLTYGGSVSGAGGTLTKLGSGTLTLTGGSSYTGTTTISNGTLAVSNGAVISDAGLVAIGSSGTFSVLGSETIGQLSGSGAVSIASGQSLTTTFDSSAVAFSGAVTGSGALTKGGTGTLTLSGSNNFSGGTAVSTGAVMVGNDWALGSTNGATTVSSGAALQLSNVTLANEAISVTGTGVGSTGSLVGYSGNNTSLGLLTLSGNNVNTYIGAASGATLTLSNISGGNNELWVVGDGNTTIAGGATNSGATALVKTNTGTLVLAAGNAWSGNEYIRQGTVVLSNNNALGTAGTTYLGADGGTATAALVLGSGIVNSNAVDVVANGTGVRTLGYQTASGTASQLGAITLNSSSLAFNVTNGGTVLFGGGVTASAGVNDVNRLALDGGGTLIVTNSGSGIATTDRYQVRIGNGTMVIGSGSIVARTNTSGIGHSIDLGVSLDGTQVAQTASLYASNGVTVSNSIYVGTTPGDAARVIGVRGQGAGATFSGPIALADSVLTLDSTNGANLNVTGAITNFSGSNAVVKTGTGTATLSGANTYNGATIVAGGTLRVSGNNRLGNTSSALTISNGGVLEVTSAGTLTNSITIGLGNGALSNSSGGALVIAGGVSKDGTVFTSRSGSGTNVFTGVISGASANSDFVVDGGTTVFSNSMTYNGPTIITNGGTLVLGANNAVPTSSGLVLGGGTFIVGNSATRYSQQLGTLTLTENSTIDLGSYSAGSVLQLSFADSSAITWTSGRTLTITNWQGVAQQSSSVAEIIFGTGGLTSTQLGQIYFANQNISGGMLLSGTGELVPIPEPRVYAAAVALLAAVGWRERKRLRGLFAGKSAGKSLPPGA
jgi:autotransporter-associated beta strand protein